MTTTDKDWELFKQKFFAKSNINLNDYKPAQMQRRITNLMNRNGVQTYIDFYGLIDKDAKLYKEFIDYLTINVTEFFRTPEKFDELEKKVLPELLSRNSKLNIWSAGCSIGAEPYSLAMILDEVTPGVRHRILASDLDVEMLAKAKEGAYQTGELKAIAPARLHKYFKQVNGNQIIREDIKFETGFDLILCRNVVIYFTEEAKDGLYRRFLSSLKPGGVLFVGGTEAILNFREIGYQHYLPFFYRKPM